MTTEEVLDFSTNMFNDMDEDRRLHAAKWREAWNLYSNRYDWSAKRDWQSKQSYGQLPMAIEVTASIIEKATLSVPLSDFYIISGLKQEDDEKVPWIKPHIDYALERNNFRTLFSDGAKSGFLNSLIAYKNYWRKWNEEMYNMDPSAPWNEDPVKLEEVRRSEAIIEGIDPLYLFLDGSGRDKLIIHEVEVDWYDLVNEEAYDQTVVNQIQESYVDQERKAVEAAQKGEPGKAAPPPFRKVVTLHEFWGDLWSKDGILEMQNAHWVTAQNHKYLLMKPEKNGFWHRQPPIVYGSLTRKPFSVYHKSIAEDLLGLQRTLTELVNMIIDAVMYATTRGFEIDLAQVFDPEDIRRGIFPGAVIKKRGFANVQAVREIISGGVPNQALLLLQLLRAEFQAGSGATDYVQGRPLSRGRQSASEVLTKTQESYRLLEHVARGLEMQIITKLIRQLYFNSVQFRREGEVPGLRKFYDEKAYQQWAAMTDRERLMKLWANLEFEVSGLSGFVGHAQELDRLQALLGLIMRFGLAPLQQAGYTLNIKYLVDRTTTLLGFSTDKLFFKTLTETPTPVVTPTPTSQLQPTGGQSAEQPAPGPGQPVQVLPTGRPPRVPVTGA